MGRNWVSAIGRIRFVTISAALGLVVAGLALHESPSAGTGTFRDQAYAVSYMHHVKLTGVIGGKGTFSVGRKSLPGTVISIRKGKKTVGRWVGGGNCAGFGPGAQCGWRGTGTMKIGTLKGKVQIQIACQHQSNPPGVGALGPRGTLFHEVEGLRMKHCPRGPKGSKFTFTLSY